MNEISALTSSLESSPSYPPFPLSPCHVTTQQEGGLLRREELSPEPGHVSSSPTLW